MAPYLMSGIFVDGSGDGVRRRQLARYVEPGASAAAGALVRAGRPAHVWRSLATRAHVDPFSYLSVLISIILGLGIAQLLNGVGQVLRRRGHVRLYWPALGWVGLLFVLHVQTWWALFGLRAVSRWTFGGFALVLVQPVILYHLATLVLPDWGSDTEPDLRANYYDHSRSFFSLAVVLLVFSLVRDRVLAGHFPDRSNLAVHLLLFLGWGGGAITKRESYHRWLMPCTALLLAGYVVTLFRFLP